MHNKCEGCIFSLSQSLSHVMDCSTPDLPVHHQLPEFAQTHVHRVGDAIQPSHLLSSPFPSAFNLLATGSFPISQFFVSGGQSIGVSASKLVLPMNPGLISFRMDWLDLLVVPRDSEESCPTPQFKSINSSALSFLYSPTLTFIHDHWKNHSLD